VIVLKCLGPVFLFLISTVMAGEIHDAARNGDLDAVKTIIAENTNMINEKDDRDCTPLHFACDAGQMDMVRFLLANGADINAVDVDGDTPLHWAALAGKTEIVPLLIKNGAFLNAVNKNHQTPFHYVVLSRLPEAVQSLLKYDFDINARAYDSAAPLHYAILRNEIEMARMLLEKGADIEARDDYGRTPLLLVARETGNKEMAALLANQGADINAQDESGATPLSLAAWRGFEGVIDILLDRGAELPRQGQRAIKLTRYAVEKGLERLFLILVENNVNLNIQNDNGGSLLHSASAGGSIEITEMLLKKDLDINEQDRYGWTPLHYTAEKGRTAVAEFLIQRGAKLDIRSLSGQSPFNLANKYNHDDVADLLKDSGAKTDAAIFPELKGKYFGQNPPRNEPIAFALDIVASNRFEHGGVTFSPDGTEAYWSTSFPASDSGYTYCQILTSRIADGHWLSQEKADFSRPAIGDDVPFFSPDGSRLYFMSGRTDGGIGRAGRERIWMMERIGSSWSEPKLIIGGPNDMDIHWQFSVAANGNIYFSSRDDIYVSKLVNGKYGEAENLGEPVNTDAGEGSPYIAPDESYLIITRFGAIDGKGGTDLYIGFKNAAGDWTEPVNMGESINTDSNDMCPYLSPDGKYLFFNSHRSGNADIYWVDAAIIDSLKNEVFK